MKSLSLLFELLDWEHKSESKFESIFTLKTMNYKRIWDLILKTLVFYIIPAVLIITIVLAITTLPILGRKHIETRTVLSILKQVQVFSFGNYASWLLITSFYLWAYLWLLFTKTKHFGPKTDSGFVPVYKSHGELYHYATLSLLLISYYIKPDLPVQIYENMTAIILTLNLSALLICTYLISTSSEDKSFYNQYFIFRFFFGSKLHPYFLGVHLKQLILPRIGMMIWQIFNVTFLLAGIKIHGNVLDYGHLVNVLLQAIYILKSAHLEQVLVTMMEFTHDQAGFYLIWGSLVWIPAVQGFQSYLLVEHRSNISISGAVLIFCFGALAIWFNYDVLRQKRLFKEGILTDKVVKIWGKPAKGIEVAFEDIDTSTGKVFKRKSHLLISGWWGICRKMNYFWELIATIIWSIPGNSFGWTNYLYCVSLFFVFVSRSIREDQRCGKKYGKGWEDYCSIVRYRFIPFLF